MKSTNFLKTALQKNAARLITALVITLMLTSCSDDDQPSDLISYKNGAFILNEGAWGNSNSSVSFLSYQSNMVTANIFKVANGSDAILGDVLTDMGVTNNEAFLVLNSSNHIVVVDRETFKYKFTIEDLNNPRYLLNHDNKLYLTQWKSETGEVVVINPSSYEIEARIETGVGPEGIIAHKGYIWVANSGGYSKDNSVTLIDPTNNSVHTTIETPYGPTHFVVDHDQHVWVVCYGSVEYDNETWEIIEKTPSHLIQISGETFEILNEKKISDHYHSSHIGISPDGETIYTYDGRGIFSFSVNDTEFPEEPFIENNGSFYGFSVHPDNGEIYVFIVPAWDRTGSIQIHNPETGNITQTIKEGLGIGPSGIVF